jgi:vacuolar-type H+-ATPase subunit H
MGVRRGKSARQRGSGADDNMETAARVLALAQRTADAAIAAATVEADRIISEAKKEAEEIRAQARAEHQFDQVPGHEREF